MNKLITVMIVVAAATVMGCRDRALEKRLADVESRLAQLESKSTASGGITPSTSPITPTPSTPAQQTPQEKPSGPLAAMSFSTTDHDFGTVKEGEKVSYTYVVKNTGEAPLIIQNAQPSCGCTVPDWTRTPIAVGQTGFVKAEFDTKGKSGVNNKTITVTANTWPTTTVLKFKAMVVGGKDAPAAH